MMVEIGHEIDQRPTDVLFDSSTVCLALTEIIPVKTLAAAIASCACILVSLHR
jgi:hypothetical protein